MSDKCFKKCITKPGTSLDNSDQVRESPFNFFYSSKNVIYFFFL